MNINEWFYQFISALSIIYGNTITQPTSQSPLSHCEHLIHSITHLIIHTHSIIPSRVPISTKQFFCSPSFTQSLLFLLTQHICTLTHSFTHSLTHSTMHLFTHSATYLCEHESMKGQSCLVRVSSVSAFLNGMWCI